VKPGRIAQALVVVLAVWHLRGAIVGVETDRVRIRHKSGQIVELIVDDQTVLLRGKERVTLDAARQAARVIADVQPLGDGRQRALKVRLFGHH